MAATTTQQTLQEAIRHHQAGKLDKAAELYSAVLAATPGDATALHLCGVLAFQLGRNAEALALIDRAITRRGDIADFHGNRGIVLAASGQIDEAIGAYRRAITLKEAYPDVHYNLGNALKEKGKLDEAMAAWRRAVSLKADFAEAHFNLGNGLRQKGEIDEAIAEFEKVIVLRPQWAAGHHSLAAAYFEKGRYERAIQMCRQAIELKPDDAEAINTLASALSAAGKKDEALACYQKVIVLRPQFADAHNNIGIILSERSQWAEAVESFGRAIAAKLDYVQAHYNLGNALRDSGKLDGAIDSFHRALAIQPNHPPAALNLANALKDQGRMDEAIEFYRHAVASDPNNPVIGSTLIFAMHLDPNADGRAILAEARRWNDRHAAPLKKLIPAHGNDPSPERPLRVGYISADFRQHATAWVLLPLLRRRDAGQFRVYCYSSHPHCDAVTERFQAYADSWRSIFGVSDEEAARWIGEDQIDILVDLSMHTAGNRLPLISRKPAPIQVSWLGYPGTTGIEAIDYHLTDFHLSPPEEFDGHYSEKLIRLAESYWCFDPLASEPEPNSLPMDANRFVTFGCLNNFSKINRNVLDCWGRLMREVPNSRLLLLAGPGSHRQRAIEALGVEPQRVEFCGFVPREEYLRLYHRIDIALDTFPYNGHTTTLDALWMGAPLVSLCGQLAVGRAGLSQLSVLGLGDLVAESVEEYVAVATSLTSEIARLRELRSTLRERMRESPLMNAERFARKFEAAFRKIWRQWCQSRGRT